MLHIAHFSLASTTPTGTPGAFHTLTSFKPEISRRRAQSFSVRSTPPKAIMVWSIQARDMLEPTSGTMNSVIKILDLSRSMDAARFSRICLDSGSSGQSWKQRRM